MMNNETEPFLFSGEQPRAAVLLLHGLTANPSELRYLGEKLHEQGYDVYCPCLSGHDQSIEVVGQIAAQTWVDDAERALAKVFAARPSIPVFVIGLSFGSLLSVVAAGRSLVKPTGLILLSAPMKFKSLIRSILLPILSKLPDEILNRLWCMEKSERDKSDFKLQRQAFSKHSVGAAARLVQIRTMAKKHLVQMEIPLLAIQDPLDHHLNPAAVEEVCRLYKGADVQLELFPGGQHELTLGPFYEEVTERIIKFLNKRLG